MNTQVLAGLLQVVIKAAKIAGELLVDYQDKLSTLKVSAKSSQVDLVSAADNNAEDIIRRELNKHLPLAGFHGEESAGSTLPDTDYFWVVDPLDGTSNYLAGLPIWSVSIALCQSDLSPVLGCVHAPKLTQTWTAQAGQGAHNNGTRMSVRSEPTGGGMLNAMIATGFPYDCVDNKSDSCITNFQRMQTKYHKIRRLGSAAIDLAYVADGTFDALWESRLKAWDTAAGMLLVNEAGGLVRRFNGDTYKPGDPDILAGATLELINEISQVLCANG